MNPLLDSSLADNLSDQSSDCFDRDTFMPSMTYERSDEETSEVSSENGATTPYRFFEGAEKRLVLYLCENNGPDSTSVAGPDLRKISRASWEKMLDMVNCQVLNVITNEYTDAYLLSESSMFVSKNRMMIKTCGSTTLLNCLEHVLKLVDQAGFSLVEDVFYSHKNLLVPSLQLHPHNSFIKESEYLDKVFQGSSHLFGQINADRWYLYTLDNLAPTGDNRKFQSINENEHFKFEMIMEELDDKVMGLFFRQAHGPNVTAAEVTRKSKIDTLIPGMMIDDFFFQPCGYSMNGLLGKHYMTIHITPEADFSYVSFETDVPQQSYSSLVMKLIDVFKPGKFMLNILLPSARMLKIKQQQLQQQQVSAVQKVGGFEKKQQQQQTTTTPAAATTETGIHGMKLYDELLSAGGFTEDFRRCDIQMVHYNHMDILYARYVSEAVSCT